MTESTLLEEGRRRLEQAMLPEGGWGYHAGGQLFVEPKALALIALAPNNPRSTTSLEEVAGKSVKALLSCQRTTGYLDTNLEDPDPSWATAPALLALVAHGVWTSTAIAGEWLASWKAPDKAPSAEFRE